MEVSQSEASLPQGLVAAYRATEYRAVFPDGLIVLRIGQKSDELAPLFVE